MNVDLICHRHFGIENLRQTNTHQQFPVAKSIWIIHNNFPKLHCLFGHLQGLVCQADREHSTKGYFKIKTNNCSLGGKMIWAHSTHLASTKKLKKWFPAKTSGLEWTLISYKLILILNEIYFLYRHLLHLSNYTSFAALTSRLQGFMVFDSVLFFGFSKQTTHHSQTQGLKPTVGAVGNYLQSIQNLRFLRANAA